MATEPLILAVFVGLAVGGSLWFMFVWPRFEPPDRDEGEDKDASG